MCLITVVAACISGLVCTGAFAFGNSIIVFRFQTTWVPRRLQLAGIRLLALWSQSSRRIDSLKADDGRAKVL